MIVVVFQSPSRVWLCNPMNYSTPGLPGPHHLPKFAQVHIHCIGDAFQPSHPLMPFLLLPSVFPSASGTFLMSCLFTSDDQNTGASASASILSMSIQGWFPLRLTDLISLLFKELSGIFSSTTVWKHQFLGALPFLPSRSHNRLWPLGRPQPWLQTIVSKVMSLVFNTLSRFVTAFLPRSNHLISWLQLPSAVMLEPKMRKSVTASTISPSICHVGITWEVRDSLVAQLIKNLPAMRETWVWSLGWEAPLEKGTATHSSILTLRIPWIV